MERSYKLSEDKALQLFSSDSFLTLNKTLLQSQGPDATVFISNLVDKYLFFKKENKLKEGKWFFQLHSTQMEQTGMNEDKIRKYKKKFISIGILSTKMIGNPAKEWYKIDFFNLLSLMETSPAIFQRSENTEGKPCQDSEGYIMIPNNNKTKLKTISSSSKNSSIGLIIPEQFETFWKIYPRHNDKGKALTAWLKLCNKKDRPSYKEVKIAVEEQKKSERWQNPKFIPLPVTWINGRRWLDDPKEMISFEYRDKQESSYTEPAKLADKFKNQRRINSYDL